MAGVEADNRLRKSEEDGNAAIVKAAPILRQHFCLFLRVDRNRAKGNLSPSLIVVSQLSGGAAFMGFFPASSSFLFSASRRAALFAG